jgi:hypothetical protein
VRKAAQEPDKSDEQRIAEVKEFVRQEHLAKKYLKKAAQQASTATGSTSPGHEPLAVTRVSTGSVPRPGAHRRES